MAAGRRKEDTRKQQDVAVQRAKLFETSFEASSVGFGILINKLFSEVNNACCRMSGYLREEIIGKEFRMFFPNNDEYQKIEQIYPTISRPGFSTAEMRLLRKDGEILNVSMSFSACNKKDLFQGVSTIQPCRLASK